MKKNVFYVLSSIVIACPVYSNIPSFVGDLVGAGFIGHVGIASAPDCQ